MVARFTSDHQTLIANFYSLCKVKGQNFNDYTISILAFCTKIQPEQDSNPRLFGCESSALTTRLESYPLQRVKRFNAHFCNTFTTLIQNKDELVE